MKNWKLLALSLGLSVIVTGCSMGAAGHIGTDGAVQLGGEQDAAVAETQSASETVQAAEASELPATQPAETAQEAETQPEDQDQITEEPAEEQTPDLSGLQTLEEPEDTDTTQLNLDREDEQDSLPLGGSIFTQTPKQTNALDQALNQLDPQVAAELSAYYAEKADQAAAQGQTVTTEVKYQKGAVLSVLRTLTDGSGSSTLRSETFSTLNGGLYTLADFFPGVEESVWRAAVLDQLTTTLQSSGKELYEQWRTYAASSFDPDCFYLTSEGLCIYYQAGVLSLSAQQVVLPYSSLTGFVMQGQ